MQGERAECFDPLFLILFATAQQPDRRGGKGGNVSGFLLLRNFMVREIVGRRLPLHPEIAKIKITTVGRSL